MRFVLLHKCVVQCPCSVWRMNYFALSGLQDTGISHNSMGQDPSLCSIVPSGLLKNRQFMRINGPTPIALPHRALPIVVVTGLLVPTERISRLAENRRNQQFRLSRFTRPVYHIIRWAKTHRCGASSLQDFSRTDKSHGSMGHA